MCLRDRDRQTVQRYSQTVGLSAGILRTNVAQYTAEI